MRCGLDKPLFLSQAVRADADFLDRIERCLVLAPHPDDESLGCGALISLLAQKGCAVDVVFTTDGSMSHPNSRAYPAQRLIKIRQDEALQALSILGIEKDRVDFWDGKDAAFPFPGQPGSEKYHQVLLAKISMLQPQLILVPYQLDPHCDHRATWQLLKMVLKATAVKTTVWEYPIWLYELAAADDVPILAPGELKYIEVEPALLARKMNALTAHLSQTTRLIDDDPEGFILLPEVISHFNSNREYYIQKKL